MIIGVEGLIKSRIKAAYVNATQVSTLPGSFYGSWTVSCRLGEAGDGLVRHEGRGSEGFLEHVFKHAAKELFGLDVHEITYKTLRWETETRLPPAWGDCSQI